MQKILILFAFICVFLENAKSQLFFAGESAEHTWNSCTYDAMGNKYMGGMQDYYLGTSFTLRKYNPMGTVLWTINDAAATFGTKIMEVQVGANGDIFVVALINANATLNNIPLTILGASDHFLIKYDNNGNYIWHQQLASANNTVDIGGLKLLSNGDPILLGHFNANLIIDGVTHPGLGGNPSYPSTVFWTSFDQNTGAATLFNQNPTAGVMYSFAVDNNDNIIYTGYSNSQQQVSKIDIVSNVILWTVTGNGNGEWYDVCTNNNGDVYITGEFDSYMNFGGINLTSVSMYDDIMVGKIAGTTGNLLWMTSYGGVNVDNGKKIMTDSNGELYVSGFFENSANFANLTVPSNGQWDIFLAKIDPANGNPIWVTHGGSNYTDVPMDLGINPVNNNVIFTGVSGFDPSNPAEFGIVAFTDTSHASYWVETLPNADESNGKVFRDMDNSSSLNGGDLPFKNVIIEASPVNFHAASGTDGSYQMFTDTGTYALSIPYPPLYYNASTPSPQMASFSTLGQTDTANHFGFTPIPGMNDLLIHITPINYGARVGMGELYHLTYENIGTTTINNAAVSFKFPTGATFNTAVPAVTGLSQDSATWNVGTLIPGQTGFIVAVMNISSGLAINSFLDFTARINPTVGDQTPNDNVVSLSHLVINSWDPNDKRVLPEGNITPTQVAAGQWLTYTIRFQNTGNDVAYNIQIQDTLSNYLDIASLQVLAVSHGYDWTLQGNGIMNFYFPNINLPDSGTNEVESHGFIQYRVKVKNNLALGTLIENTAYIYFDFNPAIITNTTGTLVALNGTAIEEIDESELFSVYPNPANEEIFILSKENIQEISLYDITGKKLLSSENTTKLNISTFAKGVYFLEVITLKGKGVKKLVVE